MTTRGIETALVALQAAQVAFLLLHDWVPLGRLSNLEAVRGSDSKVKLFWTTELSGLPFVVGLVLSVICLPHWPHGLVIYLWVIYVTVLVGACMAWWIPYLLRPDADRAARYRVRFAGTISFLPERNGIRPDALHVMYHATVVATLVLLWML